MSCPSCGVEKDDRPDRGSAGHRPIPPPDGPRPGDVVASRYEILGTLGAGGMGTVYQAYDRILDVAVALKVLRGGISVDPDWARRFRSEIKLAWKVRHKNVCGIHEYGEDGPLRYISMELVEGHDLSRILRELGPLPWNQAYDAAIQVAEGLQAIHEVGIIHRDLKSANVTRDARGLVRLMDFGIAKEWGNQGTSITVAGKIIGTPEYMSPELIRGLEVDFRSDVYSLGVLIFELFTGDVPFRADTPVGTMVKHLAEPPPFEGLAQSRIPKPLVPILRKALEKEPAGRPASAGELAEALRIAWAATGSVPVDHRARPGRDLLTAATILPAPAASTRRVAPAAPADRRDRLRLLAVGIATAALGVTIVLFVPRPSSPPGTAAAAVAPRPVTESSALDRFGTLERRLAIIEAEKAEAVLRTREAVRQTIEAQAHVRRGGLAATERTARPPEVETGVAAPTPEEPRKPAEEPVSAVEGPGPVESTPAAAPSTLPSSPEPTAPRSPPANVTRPGTLVDLGVPGVAPPRIEHQPRIDYPPIALRRDVEGMVTLRILVDELGRVAEAEIVAAPTELAEAALRQAKARRYRPATKDGVPVKVWIPAWVHFTLVAARR